MRLVCMSGPVLATSTWIRGANHTRLSVRSASSQCTAVTGFALGRKEALGSALRRACGRNFLDPSRT